MKIPRPILPETTLWRTLPGVAANSDVELTALDIAKRLGWRGIVSAGAEATAEGIGATLWGIARVGLPILTLGLVMKGDDSRKPLRLSDFPKFQLDPQFVAELDLEFLKHQKQLAELSGNQSLAQLFNLLILQRSADLTPSTFPGQNIVTGALNMVASSGDSGSASAPSATAPSKERGAVAPFAERPSVTDSAFTSHHVTQLIGILQKPGAEMRAAAKTLHDLAYKKPELFMPDHLGPMIADSAKSAPTFFSNRTLAELARRRRDLFSGDIVTRIQEANAAPNSSGCLQQTLDALTTGPTVSATTASTPPPTVAHIHRRIPPTVPQLVMPPGHPRAPRK